MALAKFATAEEEYKKNTILKESDLEILKDWYKKQPHLPPMSDFELILFLHSNYYRIEPTKITIDMFFTLTTHIPEFFSNRDPLESKELRNIMKVLEYFLWYSCCLVLPSTTPEGYRVILVRLMDFEPSHYVFADAVKLMVMVTELSLCIRGTCPGYVIVIDMKGTTFGHITRLNPMIMKKFLHFVQEAIPIRLKGINYINIVPFMDLFLNIAKPFMNKELIDMLHFHNGTNTLSEQNIPIEILPNEEGGKAGSLKDLWADQTKEIENYCEWFRLQETRRVNETARPGKAKSPTDIFGVEGSFKKLELD